MTKEKTKEIFNEYKKIIAEKNGGDHFIQKNYKDAEREEFLVKELKKGLKFLSKEDLIFLDNESIDHSLRESTVKELYKLK